MRFHADQSICHSRVETEKKRGYCTAFLRGWVVVSLLLPFGVGTSQGAWAAETTVPERDITVTAQQVTAQEKVAATLVAVRLLLRSHAG